MTIIIRAGLAVLNFIYFFFKLAPVRNKVVFISRQSNTPSADFIQLRERINQRYGDIQVVMLCKTLDGHAAGKIAYCFHMLRQMAALATSRVAVLDSYCILASCLHHKKELTIIQMWHALGCSKKFGLSILDMPSGSSSKLAHAMHMHQQYDLVFASAEICRPFFAQAFGTPVEKIIVQPLPRVDGLTDPANIEQTRQAIISRYPALAGKTAVLYAPTFRKDETVMQQQTDQLLKAFDFSRFNLIVSLHPLSKLTIADSRVISDRQFTSLQWAMAADIVITDYSAVVYEFALLNKPMLFWAFDKEEYAATRSFYIDYDSEMPGPICLQTAGLLAELAKTDLKADRTAAFASKYIDPGKRRHNTDDIVSLIKSKMK